jgi:hypothetical protein
MERAMGITFPSSRSQVEVFDNGEYWIVAHLKLREQDIASFANMHKFDTEPVNVPPWIDALSLENRVIPMDADLRYLEGRSVENRWVCVLDQSSGRLWIVFFYPDLGGDLP